MVTPCHVLHTRITFLCHRCQHTQDPVVLGRERESDQPHCYCIEAGRHHHRLTGKLRSMHQHQQYTLRMITAQRAVQYLHELVNKGTTSARCNRKLRLLGAVR